MSFNENLKEAMYCKNMTTIQLATLSGINSGTISNYLKTKGSMLVTDKKVLEELIELQKEKDIADIELLWKGAIENNKVVEFALKKLATPESARANNNCFFILFCCFYSFTNVHLLFVDTKQTMF